MTIGEYLYQYRIKNDLSMEDLGNKIGVSRAYISMLENGNSARDGKVPVPSIHTLTKIAKATDIDVMKLMNLTTPTANQVVEFVEDEKLEDISTLYARASESDKAVIEMILDKYRT